ncbi:lysoplasmalogenase family protein [Albidovulum sp.]|uniref:lysoplasmalogenase family protein n=1 Tax=Albidovulum sp. TaxID=1872424 RepID=UPI0039B8B609
MDAIPALAGALTGALAGALAAAGAALALLYGAVFAGGPPGAAKSAVKTGSVVALALAGVAAGAPGLVVAGLALGAAGDFFLSRAGTVAFLAGMAAFAAGHLAYGAAFLNPGVSPPAFPALALAALGLSTEVWLAPRTGALRWPVRGYVAVITLMALAALTLPAPRWPALLGALLFLLSDLLLALELFVLSGGGPKRLAGRVLWAAYWSGQALILWGMVPPAAP